MVDTLHLVVFSVFFYLEQVSHISICLFFCSHENDFSEESRVAF